MGACFRGQKIGTNQQDQQVSRREMRFLFTLPFPTGWDLLLIPGLDPTFAFERTQVDIEGLAKGAIHRIIAIVDRKRWQQQRRHRIMLLPGRQ